MRQGLVDCFAENFEASAISKQAVVAFPFVSFKPWSAGFVGIHGCGECGLWKGEITVSVRP